MPFSDKLQADINSYITSDLPTGDWSNDYFNFISHERLAKRLSEEYYTIRYLYKFFEGMQNNESLKNGQVRIQIFYYASIYEAVIHHVLFDLLADRQNVKALLTYPKLKQISVGNQFNGLIHDGKSILTVYQDQESQSSSKVRFERKVDVCKDLGLLNDDLGNDLKQIYKLRNAIHLHNELSQSLIYEIDMAKLAYRRLQPFKQQIVSGMSELGV